MYAWQSTYVGRFTRWNAMRALLLLCGMLIGTGALLPSSARSQALPVGDTLYDVVIRNGRVLDGQGNPWIASDVAIKDGRFVKIGKVTGRGRRELDAADKYVSPGWIDMMDQSGGVLRRSGVAENKLQEGVTTAIGGEGGTPVPAGRVAEYFANFTLRARARSSRVRMRSAWRRNWPWSMHQAKAFSSSAGVVSVDNSLVSVRRSTRSIGAARKPTRQFGARIFANPLT